MPYGETLNFFGRPHTYFPAQIAMGNRERVLTDLDGGAVTNLSLRLNKWPPSSLPYIHDTRFPTRKK